jgi:hypothetical protein
MWSEGGRFCVPDEGFKPERFHEIIEQNVQQGNAFAMRFRGDPARYVGIPILDMSLSEDVCFVLKIFEPEEEIGIMSRPIGDIEWMNNP